MDYIGLLVAYARFFPPGKYFEEASIGRIVTAPEVRGRGAGKALMAKSREITRRMYGEVPVRIGAQRYLERFYQGFGFRIVGTPYVEDGIPHVHMLREPE